MRFTISHHTGSVEGEHYDLFFQVESTLKTWRVTRTIFDTPQPATRIDDHRVQYLDYEGPVSKNRGQVRVWDTGDYAVDVWRDDRVIAAVHGKHVRARLRLDRVKPDDPSAWLVADASLGVRKLATSLLRESSLEAAPTEPLGALGDGLAKEERTLLALVDAYAKGAEVAWDRAAVDASLREKLASERARWRHPWLDAAVEHARRLEEIARELKGGRA